jgi:putative oxidoreductase
LHAAGHRGTGAGFESLGIRPAVVAAVLAGSAEVAAGFSLAAGLLTPVGTVLVGAVMITAILKVHVSNGIWAAEGGFEFPPVLLTVGFAITALCPGALSVDSWLGIDNWAGINWTINPAARSAIAVAIGLAGGLIQSRGRAHASDRFRKPAHTDPRLSRHPLHHCAERRAGPLLVLGASWAARSCSRRTRASSSSPTPG